MKNDYDIRYVEFPKKFNNLNYYKSKHLNILYINKDINNNNECEIICHLSEKLNLKNL